MYLQWLHPIREHIVSEAWESGRQLPARTKLASELNINRVTVHQAFQSIAEQGLITRTPGKDTFNSFNLDKKCSLDFVGYVVPRVNSALSLDTNFCCQQYKTSWRSE
jgi:DNA-binding GntR family transcriptional regulator